VNRLALLAWLSLAACNRSSEPEKVIVVASPPATPAPRAPVDDQRLANDIAQTAKDVYAMPPEPIADRDKAAAIAPTALVGTWHIKHIIYINDGKRGAPTLPIVDGSWVFTSDGKFEKLGGNELEGAFVLTKDKLVVSALGPALDYTIDKLTAKDLVVTMMIMPGMGTSTVLEKVK
jgi:hypothetical protein